MQNCNSWPVSARGKAVSSRPKRARARGWRIIDLHRNIDKVRVVKVRSFVDHIFDQAERDQWRRNLVGELLAHTFIKKR